MRAVVIVAVLAIAGCIEANLVPCGELLCGVDQACTANGCVDRSRIDACDGLADNDACSVDGAPGTCRDGACATQVCGDGVIDAPEECEGGNVGGATCLTFGFYEPEGLSCSDSCRLEVSACVGTCGDGAVNGPELCDTTPGDAFTCSQVGFDYGGVTCSSALCAPLYDACTTFRWRLRGHNLDTPSAISSPKPGVTYLGDSNGYLLVVNSSSTFEPLPAECGYSISLWASIDDVAFVGTSNGVCRHTSAGWQWFPMGQRRGVWGTSATDVYAVGDDVQHFDGTQWSMVPTSLAASTNVHVMVRGTDLAITRQDGSVALRRNGVWEVSTVVANASLSRPWISPMGEVYVIATAKLYKYTSGTWGLVAPQPPGPAQELWGISDRAIYVSDNQRLWAFDQTSWTEAQLPESPVGFNVLTGSDRHIVLVPAYQEFFESSGFFWSTNAPEAEPFDFFAPLVWAFDATHVMLIRNTSSVLINGTTSQQYNAASTISDVWGIGGTLFGAGTAGISIFNGSGWTFHTSTGTDCRPRNIGGESANRVFLIDASGICMWNGSTLSRVDNHPNATAVWGSATRGTYVVTMHTMLHLPPGAPPTEWVEEALPEQNPLAIWGDDTQLIVTFISRRIFRRALSQTTWTELPHQLEFPIIELFGTADDLFGIAAYTGEDRELVRWDGLSWDRVSTPDSMTAPQYLFASSDGVWVTSEGTLVRLFRPR